MHTPKHDNQFIIDDGVPQAVDVTAVNRRADRNLYATRQKIYPKLVHGSFRRIKWGLLFATLGIYYMIPWVRWERGPGMPTQAVLLDMEHERFFLFGLEIWPQEFYFVTGLLVLAALSLYLVTALAGRVWCGYFCPQTVWTDLMVAVERFWQGDRSERIRLDKEPWGARKLIEKSMTHASWLLIAMATGGAFVFYFADAPTLAGQLLTGTAPEPAYIFIAILTFTTYLLGGIAREQVCIYMCPWPRIQGAMIDKDSFLVSYRDGRGEPRGPMQKHAAVQTNGDCIDCKACIAVCPMGIDIRDGAQLECIQCALCIDACNDIMAKINRPRNLIGYATIAGLAAELNGQTSPPRLARPRTLLYAGLIAVVGLIMLAALQARSTLELNVLADRNPLFVRLKDGGIRNGYTLKISNKTQATKVFQIKLENLDGAHLALEPQQDATTPCITVPPDAVSDVRAFVSMPPSALKIFKTDAHPFQLVVEDPAGGTEARRGVSFRMPKP
jgi:cytochrome c oxidase accessory protein FixG